MVLKVKRIYSQSFSNVKKKYRYIPEINEIVLEEEVEDLIALHNSYRHTCLEETLKRFLGEDFAKLYGDQNIVFDDDTIVDEYTKVDKLEFYTHMNNFICDVRKKFKLPDTFSLNDAIDFCSKNVDSFKKIITDKEKQHEKISIEQTSK